MTNGGEARDAANGSAEPRLLCLVPDDLESKLFEALRRHYAADPTVEVLVEERSRERRSGRERRKRDQGPPSGEEERRVIRNKDGRRIAERRAVLVPTDAPGELPRKARPYADRIAFVERLPYTEEQLEDMDTGHLVTSIQAGDRDAFASLYTRYFDRVYGYLRLALADSHEAEDVAQQVFTQVFEKLGSYEKRRQPFRAWLFVIARNQAIDHLRRRREISVDAVEEINHIREQSQGDEGEVDVLNWISDHDLVLFLDRLPAAQRQVLLMRFMLDLPTDEIARMLNRSHDDVRMLQHRGLRFLRDRLSAVGRAPKRHEGRSRSRRCRPKLTVLRSRRWALSR